MTITVAITLVMHSLLYYSPDVQSYVIHGRAIDSRGVPVKNALVFYGREEIGETGSTFEGVKTNESGEFSLPIESYMRLQPFFLFVTSEMPDKTMTLMFPPFTSTPRSIKRRFAGPRIILDEQREVSIGDVMVKATFFPVTLALLDKEGKKRLSTPEQWASVVVRLLEQDGNPIAATGMSQIIYKECVNFAESQIRVAVPEGSWRIEVSITDFSGPFFGVPVQVPRSNNNSQISRIIIPN